MKKTILVLATLVSATAMAANPAELKKTRKLESLRYAFEEICHAGADNLDCWVAAYPLKPSKSGWANAVRKLLLSMEYVDDVSASLVDEECGLNEALREVGYNAGVEPESEAAYEAFDMADERLQNDVRDESTVLAVTGSVGGEFGLDHTYFAVVDTKNRQVLVISAGYSE